MAYYTNSKQDFVNTINAADLESIETGFTNIESNLDAMLGDISAETFTAGVAMDFNNKAMTNVDINSGAIDGAIIGANSAAAVTCTALSMTVNDDTEYSAAGYFDDTHVVVLSNNSVAANSYAGIRFGLRASDTALAAIAAVTPSANNSELHFSVENAGTPIDAALIDSSGNVGIGAVPGTLQSTYTGLKLGGNANLWSLTAETQGSIMFFGHNCQREDALADHYISTDEASRYAQQSGNHMFDVAASGTAGTDITWTRALTIQVDGDIDFDSVGVEWQASAGAGTASSQAGYITVDVGGATKYIALYDSVA